MQVEPDERYQSAAGMYEDLIGRPITAGSDIMPAARRGKWTALWLALAGLLLVVAAIFLFLPAVTPDSQPTLSAAAAADSGKGNGEGSRPPESTEPALSGGTTPSTALEVVAIAASPTPDSTLQGAETADVAAATVTPTAAPSFTPVATATLSPTPAASPTARPTNLPVKPTSTRLPTITPSPTRMPTVTRAPTPIPPPPADGPEGAAGMTVATTSAGSTASGGGPRSLVLLEPPENTNTNSPTLFAWKPDAPLADGQVYEVAFWKPGETEESGQSWTPAGTSTNQLINPGGRIGSYRWGVWLGHFNAAGKYERIRFLGGDRTFDVTSGGSSNRDGGTGDGSGNDSAPAEKGG